MTQSPESLLGPPPVALSVLKQAGSLMSSPANVQSSLMTLPLPIGHNFAVLTACISRQPQPKLSQKLLQQAFSAGLKALEVLGIETSERLSSSSDKILKPDYASGVRVVTTIACTLGNQQILKAVEGVRLSVTSPYILHETALAVAQHLSLEHPHQLEIHLRREPSHRIR